MNIWIINIIASIDWMNEAKPYILFRNDNVPFNVLKRGLQPEQYAREIFGESLDLDSDWAKMKTIDIKVDEDDDEMWIIYGCLVPYEAQLGRGCHWVAFDYNLQDHSWYNEMCKIVRGIE